MTEYGGHPFLMAALFFEMHFKRLQARYRELSASYTKAYYITFIEANATSETRSTSRYKDQVHQASTLAENLDSLEIELLAFSSRVLHMIDKFKVLEDSTTDAQRLYLEKCGFRLKENLRNTLREKDYLQAKNTICRDNARSLIALVSGHDHPPEI
jgi:hypothetical protein